MLDSASVRDVASGTRPYGLCVFEPLEDRLLLAASTPTIYDQYMLELINRGRANPAAEAARYGISLNEGVPAADTISTAAKQPLAFNPQLVYTAQNHSQWMLDHDVFSHYEGAVDPFDRMTAAGYSYSTAGENIGYKGTTGTLDLQAYTAELHRLLFVDQNYQDRGHRVNLMDGDFREVGLGVVQGLFTDTGTTYNAAMVTQDFGSRGGNAFLTGVVYNDNLVTNNDFYTPGEGLGGVTVKAVNIVSAVSYEVTTWSSGGYSLQLPAGTYGVTFSGGGFGGSVTYSNVVVGSTNVKVDATLDMVQAPTLTTVNTLTGAIENQNFTITYAMLAAAADEHDDGGHAISFGVVAVSSGTLTKNGTAVVPGSTLLSAGESMVWRPAANANGVLNAFTVKAWNGVAESTTAVQVKVDVAYLPTLTAVSTLVGATEDLDFTINYDTLAAAANEFDKEGKPISFRVQAVSGGTLTKGSVAVAPGTTLLSTGESLVWHPAANANGTLNAFTVKAWNGFNNSATAVQVKVSVSAANDPPVLTKANTLTGAREDVPFTIAFSSLAAACNESDAEGNPISFRIQSVTQGSLRLNGVDVSAGTTLFSAGSLVWTPPANANGVMGAFAIRAFDGTADSAADVPVLVNVAAVNDVPILTTIDSFDGAVEDAPFAITFAELLAAGDAWDQEASAISFRVDSINGSLKKNGVSVYAGTYVRAGDTLSWTPAANANGMLTAFTVRAYDGAAVSASAVGVRVQAAAVNDAPTLTTAATLTGATVGHPFVLTYAAMASAANEADVDGDAVTFRLTALSGALSDAVLSPGGQVTWTAPEGTAAGVHTGLSATVSDGALSSTLAVPVRVSVALPDLQATAAGSGVNQSAVPGTVVNWTAAVKNASTGWQHADWTVEWYLSTDTVWGASDTPIGSRTYSDDVAPGASMAAELIAAVPAVPLAGQKYVIARVVNSEAERVSTNNVKAAADRDWFGAIAADVDDAVVRNDSLAAATDLGLIQGTRTLSRRTLDGVDVLGDVDCYRFSIGKAGGLYDKVRIDFLNAEGDLTLRLLDSGGNVIRTSDTAGNFEQIGLGGLAAGEYWFDVSGKAGDLSRNYGISLRGPL